MEKSFAEQAFLGLAFFLLLTILGGLARVYRGPSPADRMISAQLFGSTGVAILLLLAEALRQPELRNVALVFAVLAVLAMVAFVERSGEEAEE